MPANRQTQIRTTQPQLMTAYWQRVLNGLVYELYFPEEPHVVGLRSFDLVGQARLAKFEGVGGAVSHSTEAGRPARPGTAQGQAALAALRQKFEEFHDGAHLLRSALVPRLRDQILGIIRIIESKA